MIRQEFRPPRADLNESLMRRKNPLQKHTKTIKHKSIGHLCDWLTRNTTSFIKREDGTFDVATVTLGSDFTGTFDVHCAEITNMVVDSPFKQPKVDITDYLRGCIVNGAAPEINNEVENENLHLIPLPSANSTIHDNQLAFTVTLKNKHKALVTPNGIIEGVLLP